MGCAVAEKTGAKHALIADCGGALNAALLWQRWRMQPGCAVERAGLCKHCVVWAEATVMIRGSKAGGWHEEASRRDLPAHCSSVPQSFGSPVAHAGFAQKSIGGEEIPTQLKRLTLPMLHHGLQLEIHSISGSLGTSQPLSSVLHRQHNCIPVLNSLTLTGNQGIGLDVVEATVVSSLDRPFRYAYH